MKVFGGKNKKKRQSGVNFIQRLLRTPICRRDMHLFFLKYAFDCNCETQIKLQIS